MFWIRTIALTVVLGVSVSAEDKKPTEFDAKALVGKWTITTGMKAGEKTDAEKLKDPLIITADTMTLKTPDATFVFKYTVDSKAKPVSVEMEMTEPEGFKGAKAKGLVMMDGEVLHLSYNPQPDGARPKDFKSTKENGSHVYTMKKAKKEEK